MSSMEPPPFQEAARCDVCKCSFNTFRRRHHCRCCGRTLCYEHSSSQMVLPQFGIHTPVRVCADCFNNSTKPVKHASQTSAGIDQVSDSVARLDITADIGSKAEPIGDHHRDPGVPECKCGMPLCICEAPAPSTDALPQQGISTTVQSIPKPKKMDVPKNRGSSSNSKGSLVEFLGFKFFLFTKDDSLRYIFNAGEEINGSSEKPKMDYEANGEGLREAIKNDDAAAVKKLLREGVDANYRDRQGMSLLHLAAVFNRTDIAFILMESGASTYYRNTQGETALDCAPATLQYKMRKRLEGGD